MNGKHSCSEVNYISIWKSLFKTTIWKSLFKPRIGTKPRGSVDHGGKSIWNAIWKDYLDHDLEKLLKPSMMSIIERAKWTATLWYKSVQLINAHRSSSLGPFYVTTHLVPGDFSEPHSCSLGPLMLATFRVAFSKSYIDATIPWTTTFERCSVTFLRHVSFREHYVLLTFHMTFQRATLLWFGALSEVWGHTTWSKIERTKWTTNPTYSEKMESQICSKKFEFFLPAAPHLSPKWGLPWMEKFLQRWNEANSH